MKIGIADDHPFILEAYKNALSEHDIVILANNGFNLIEEIKKSKNDHLPDLILLDLNMPVLDGYEAAKWIKYNFPTIKIVICTMNTSEITVLKLIEIGVDGYVFKNELSFDELKNLVKQIEQSGIYYPDYISKILARSVQNKVVEETQDEIKLSTLTEREKSILKLVCKEYTGPEISKLLFISPRTVELHRKNIISKLNVRNTIGAVIFAQKVGLNSE